MRSYTKSNTDDGGGTGIADESHRDCMTRAYRSAARASDSRVVAPCSSNGCSQRLEFVPSQRQLDMEDATKDHGHGKKQARVNALQPSGDGKRRCTVNTTRSEIGSITLANSTRMQKRGVLKQNEVQIGRAIRELKRETEPPLTSESPKFRKVSQGLSGTSLASSTTGPSGTPYERRCLGGTGGYAGGGGSPTVGGVTSPTPRADPSYTAALRCSWGPSGDLTCS